MRSMLPFWDERLMGNEDRNCVRKLIATKGKSCVALRGITTWSLRLSVLPVTFHSFLIYRDQEKATKMKTLKKFFNYLVSKFVNIPCYLFTVFFLIYRKRCGQGIPPQKKDTKVPVPESNDIQKQRTWGVREAEVSRQTFMEYSVYQTFLPITLFQKPVWHFEGS